MGRPVGGGYTGENEVPSVVIGFPEASTVVIGTRTADSDGVGVAFSDGNTGEYDVLAPVTGFP